MMLASVAGFEFIHVPDLGAAPAIGNLLGGQIAASILPIDVTLPLIQAGDVRALVTTGPQRSKLLSDVPTVKEAGYPTLEVIDWLGVFVPARTPAATVNNLNNDVAGKIGRIETYLDRKGERHFAYQPDPAHFGKHLLLKFERIAFPQA
jgi:tripartite-type tricarboxylate transporter receptor subunit TctC